LFLHNDKIRFCSFIWLKLLIYRIERGQLILRPLALKRHHTISVTDILIRVLPLPSLIVLVVTELNDWNESYGRHDDTTGTPQSGYVFHIDGVWC